MPRSARAIKTLLVATLIIALTGLTGVNPAAAATDYRNPDATAMSPADMRTYENDLAAIIAKEQNEARVANGLAPLSWSVAVEGITDAHTEAMAAAGNTYHSDLRHLIDGFPSHRWAGENVIGMYETSGEATDLWLASPGHRANLLADRATHMSVAVRCDDTGRLYSTVHFIDDPTAPNSPLPQQLGSASPSDGCRNVRRADRSTTTYVSSDGVWTPFALPEDLVRRQHRDVMGFEVDATTLRDWSGDIRSGRRSRADFAAGLLLSTNFDNKVSAVARLYRASFLRDPSADELNYWVSVQTGGASLSDVAWGFLNSEELRLRYGNVDDQQLVTLMYNNVLNRQPDADGMSYWLDQRARGLSAHDLILNFSNSEEFRKTTKVHLQIHLAYVTMLGQAPDEAAYSYWTAQFGGGRGVADLVLRFMDSDEYARRIR